MSSLLENLKEKGIIPLPSPNDENENIPSPSLSEPPNESDEQILEELERLLQEEDSQDEYREAERRLKQVEMSLVNLLVCLHIFYTEYTTVVTVRQGVHNVFRGYWKSFINDEENKGYLKVFDHISQVLTLLQTAASNKNDVIVSQKIISFCSKFMYLKSDYTDMKLRLMRLRISRR